MKRNVVLISILALLFLSAVVWASWLVKEVPNRESVSPDGKYELVVLVQNIWRVLPFLPGQGADAKYVVELRERESGKRIFRDDTHVVQEIGEIHWSEKEVWVNDHLALSYEGAHVEHRKWTEGGKWVPLSREEWERLEDESISDGKRSTIETISIRNLNSGD